jgi:hypothetical protein
LIFKEFSVPTAPEVGRIIERLRGASSAYFTKAEVSSHKLQEQRGVRFSYSLQLEANACL